MSVYTFEIRTGLLTKDNNIHTWIQITKPDGTKEAWGFGPADDAAWNVIYGQGVVKDEDPEKEFTQTSGPMLAGEEAYQKFIAYKDLTSHQTYSLPYNPQCSIWAVKGLCAAGVFPEILGYLIDIQPLQFGTYLTVIINPESVNTCCQRCEFEIPTRFFRNPGYFRPGNFQLKDNRLFTNFEN